MTRELKDQDRDRKLKVRYSLAGRHLLLDNQLLLITIRKSFSNRSQPLPSAKSRNSCQCRRYRCKRLRRVPRPRLPSRTLPRKNRRVLQVRRRVLSSQKKSNTSSAVSQTLPTNSLTCRRRTRPAFPPLFWVVASF